MEQLKISLQNNKVNLFSKDWAFRTDKTNELTHSLHPYTAKFVPALTQTLIDFFTTEQDLVFDPFCGSGTVLVEAERANRKWLGTDISPLACLISKVKTTKLSEAQMKKALEVEKAVKKEIEQTYNKGYQTLFKENLTPDIPNMENWFSRYSIIELSILKRAISSVKDKNVKDFLLVVFSSIITTVSNQDSETRYTININKKITKFFVIRQFRERLIESIEKIRKLNELRTDVKGTAYVEDARQLNKVESDSADFILTSPPYLNAWDYNLYHRFRFFWLGYDVDAYKKNEIGSHLAHSYSNESPKWFFKDMRKSIEQMHRVLKDKRFCCIVIGNSTVKGKKINSVRAIVGLAKQIGFSHISTIDRPIPATKKRMNSKIGKIATESIIVLQKNDQITNNSNTLFAFTFQDYVQHGLERDLAILQLKRFFNTSPISETNQKIIFLADLQKGTLDELRRIALFKRVQLINIDGITTLIPDQAFFEYSDFLSEFADDENKINYYLNRIVQNHFGHKVSKYLSHSFHDYIGRLYPQIVRSLIFSYNYENGRVLDPFSGSGTTQIESSLMGIPSIGVENNPLQTFLSNTKLNSLSISISEIDESIKHIEDKIRNSSYTETYPESLKNWFDKSNLNQLLVLKKAIDQEDNVKIRNFLFLCLSSITKDVSNWVPGQARVRKRKTLLGKLDVYSIFIDRVKTYRNSIKIFQIIKNKTNLMPGNSETINDDSRELSALPSGNFTLAITSPPYANALPYMETDRLPATLLDFFDKKSYLDYLGSEIGNREINSSERTKIEAEFLSDSDNPNLSENCKKLISELIKKNTHLPKTNFRRRDHAAVLFKYYSDINEVFGQVYRLLAPKGIFIVVIGNNKLRAGEKWLDVESDKYFIEMAEKTGFKLEATFKKELQGTTNFFSKIKTESILVLRKSK